MVDEPIPNREEELVEGDQFSVKGKPSLNLSHKSDTDKSQLKFILQQKIEEIKEERKNSPNIVATTKGAEFKPESIPFIPDVTHPVMTKQEHSTIERVAGYQDQSLVPPMYREQIQQQKEIDRKKKEAKEPPIPKPDITKPLSLEDKFETNISTIINTIADIVEEKKPVINANPQRGKEAEFTMKVSREKMHHGGIYMKNEYRPYRPGS